ncbi:sensor protein FixL [Variibacter gotjawalensis]|uniref:histidine kinase n=1 Tax=Variibacter gotjawalensis TaxID=1333996 RepID=A0A0S3PP46_9BRAD|nr:HAMP domain-containing sensor histidine kinase [Variibacter gotjawalensis]NIK48001.1 signal transduction histidine kinase [Variibacter gotjawalensis]RZS49878.1 signal transduction histidine kinase [Variibacter gotjawalensis]BAT57707.1 sensor protein FixL [Variibacter gotjawalensis]
MTDTPVEPPKETLRARFGLSSKLLVLTTLFVLITEILVYVPAIANFRLGWLGDRIAAAQTAALVLQAAPTGTVPESLAREILDSVGAKAVATKTGQQRRLLALSTTLPPVDHDIDLRTATWMEAVTDAFETLFSRDNDSIRVVGHAPMGGDFIELVLDEAPLRNAMLRFSGNVLLLSLFISTATAVLVFVSLHWLFVRPMRRITEEVVTFRRDPQNPANIMATTGRSDEIGIAERELSGMQKDLAAMLSQKSRLAALGLAVSKINHDLRNLLGSAQLISDRLADVKDPTVQRFAPKLMFAIERAIDFCQSTLSYGGAQEPVPQRRMVELAPVVEELREALAAGGELSIGFVVSIERGLEIDADPEQIFRVLMNLGRNAMQALGERTPPDPERDQVRIAGRREGAVVVIEVSDTGPGVPARAKDHLFEAFSGSTRPGGSGLGLAIVAELVRAHGGEIGLAEGTLGATFRFTIPDRAVDLTARRKSARA